MIEQIKPGGNPQAAMDFNSARQNQPAVTLPDLADVRKKKNLDDSQADGTSNKKDVLSEQQELRKVRNKR